MIKYKNGEKYYIRKPNPLMKEQDIWNDYILHNFIWKDEKGTSTAEEIKYIEEQQEEEEIENIEQEIKDTEEEKHIENIKEEIKDIEEEEELKKIKQDTESFCLVAKNILEKDEIYGEIKQKIKYSKKIKIKIKILNQNDLILNFYSKEELEINSIIFPRNKDKRWWKIKKIKNKIYECVPSDITPSFE